MTKQDKIHSVLLKVDYLWQQRGWSFCKALKEVFGEENIAFGNIVEDDQILENIKSIDTNKKVDKEK